MVRLWRSCSDAADPAIYGGAGSVRVVLGRRLSPVPGESRSKAQKCRDRHEALPFSLEKRARVRRGRDCPLIVDTTLWSPLSASGPRKLSIAALVSPVMFLRSVSEFKATTRW